MWPCTFVFLWWRRSVRANHGQQCQTSKNSCVAHVEFCIITFLASKGTTLFPARQISRWLNLVGVARGLASRDWTGCSFPVENGLWPLFVDLRDFHRYRRISASSGSDAMTRTACRFVLDALWLPVLADMDTTTALLSTLKIERKLVRRARAFICEATFDQSVKHGERTWALNCPVSVVLKSENIPFQLRHTDLGACTFKLQLRVYTW